MDIFHKSNRGRVCAYLLFMSGHPPLFHPSIVGKIKMSSQKCNSICKIQNRLNKRQYFTVKAVIRISKKPVGWLEELELRWLALSFAITNFENMKSWKTTTISSY